ncbi:uncharacterized protein BJ171DRAFT_500146 [Polychytrium aggregatum]|uniref:uncharacterized protein n=1 Tax=Polychytrium aggregatum TaxID=110093 RepID=UPI0022FF23FE|nr:uncharacterized protein BJ171DRAFT_500146 [Polychytrium aggregatum]KAI9205939.1 hypothetical protein BJ171DRAFT_500146 [Polychytrium aggregatum]
MSRPSCASSPCGTLPVKQTSRPRSAVLCPLHRSCPRPSATPAFTTPPIPPPFPSLPPSAGASLDLRVSLRTSPPLGLSIDQAMDSIHFACPCLNIKGRLVGDPLARPTATWSVAQAHPTLAANGIPDFIANAIPALLSPSPVAVEYEALIKRHIIGEWHGVECLNCSTMVAYYHNSVAPKPTNILPVDIDSTASPATATGFGAIPLSLISSLDTSNLLASNGHILITKQVIIGDEVTTRVLNSNYSIAYRVLTGPVPESDQVPCHTPSLDQGLVVIHNDLQRTLQSYFAIRRGEMESRIANFQAEQRLEFQRDQQRAEEQRQIIWSKIYKAHVTGANNLKLGLRPPAPSTASDHLWHAMDNTGAALGSSAVSSHSNLALDASGRNLAGSHKSVSLLSQSVASQQQQQQQQQHVSFAAPSGTTDPLDTSRQVSSSFVAREKRLEKLAANPPSALATKIAKASGEEPAVASTPPQKVKFVVPDAPATAGLGVQAAQRIHMVSPGPGVGPSFSSDDASEMFSFDEAPRPPILVKFQANEPYDDEEERPLATAREEAGTEPVSVLSTSFPISIPRSLSKSHNGKKSYILGADGKMIDDGNGGAGVILSETEDNDEEGEARRRSAYKARMTEDLDVSDSEDGDAENDDLELELELDDDTTAGREGAGRKKGGSSFVAPHILSARTYEEAGYYLGKGAPGSSRKYSVV